MLTAWALYIWALCFKQTANTNKYQWQCNSSGAWEYPDFLQGHDGSQYKQNNKYVVSMFHKSKRTQKTNKAGHNRPLGKKYIVRSPQTSAFLIKKNWLLLWECLSNKRDRKAHKWNSCKYSLKSQTNDIPDAGNITEWYRQHLRRQKKVSETREVFFKVNMRYFWATWVELATAPTAYLDKTVQQKYGKHNCIRFFFCGGFHTSKIWMLWKVSQDHLPHFGKHKDNVRTL